MSLRLILMRHAKSDWGSPELNDHDRPLNARGRKAAVAMGAWVGQSGWSPDLALLSTATRVRETWERASGGLDAVPPVELDPALYLAPPEDMLAALAVRTQRSILLLGHNPGLAALAQWLVAETPERVEFHEFPTAATLVLSIDREDWHDLGERCAQVLDFVVPRDLAGQ
ncbi:phosphohistidine phosphatase [Palleronia aestuarii]|uniref:Phosphohistidine phosphatase n=1 Tax=Palleronia aestuarii TaxID=568105 RepID=A0A2W7MX92_9RHOB|nr:histidine phosphatase family protein [Palleronia aestuarii]PZX12271.1 phosphohistidine phosphatase [Palleronia aestuarii]